jgi:hypothetical protein
MKLIRIASCLIMIFSACVWNCEASRVQHNRTLSSAECRSIFGSDFGECVLDWNCEAYDTCAFGNSCPDCEQHKEEVNSGNGQSCNGDPNLVCSADSNGECMKWRPCRQNENYECVPIAFVEWTVINGKLLCVSVPVE